MRLEEFRGKPFKRALLLTGIGLLCWSGLSINPVTDQPTLVDNSPHQTEPATKTARLPDLSVTAQRPELPPVPQQPPRERIAFEADSTILFGGFPQPVLEVFPPQPQTPSIDLHVASHFLNTPPPELVFPLVARNTLGPVDKDVGYWLPPQKQVRSNMIASPEACEDARKVIRLEGKFGHYNYEDKAVACVFPEHTEIFLAWHTSEQCSTLTLPYPATQVTPKQLTPRNHMLAVSAQEDTEFYHCEDGVWIVSHGRRYVQDNLLEEGSMLASRR